MGELGFVGAGRMALVDRLVDEFEAVSREGVPRLVTLEAPSGWGKSRVVHELYRRLAAAQPEPRFWPASILDAVAGADELVAQQRRKRIYPEVFTPAPKSVPHWLWWGISATARKSGTAVDALASDLRQIEVHAQALERRWRQVTGRKERLGRLLRGGQAASLGEAASQELLSAGLDKLIEASVPGLGLMWWAAKLTVSQRERWAPGSRAPVGVELGAEVREDMVAGVASSLGHFASAGIPIVIAVEDAHEADASLVELLVRTIDERRGPILIVATAWPGFLDDDGRAAHRLVAEVPAPARTRLHTAANGHEQLELYAELDVGDRVVLVEQLLPEASVEGRRALAKRYANPLLLELVCQSRRVAELIEDDELSEVEVARLPGDLDDVYRDMWRSLPDELQEALMLAVLATPSTIGQLFDDRSWDIELTAAGWGALDRFAEKAGQLRSLLSDTGDAYAWIRSVDRWLQACHEPAQHEIARSFAVERHSERTHRRFYQALADSIDLDAPDLTPPQRRTRAQLLTALASEGFIDWTPAATVAGYSLFIEATQAHDVDSLRTVIALGTAIPATNDEHNLERRHTVAIAYGSLGQLGQAIGQLQVLLNDCTQLLGADHPNTLTTRSNLASWLGRVGRVQEAIEQITVLLDDQVRLLGPDHPNTLTWPLLTAGVGLPPRLRPSAAAYAPVNFTALESLCSRDRSMSKRCTASSTSRVSRLARSASNSRPSIRPTRSSLSRPTSSVANPTTEAS